MIKLNFNTPVPHSQRDNVIRGLKALGFRYERINTDQIYSLHRFYGRLPTFKNNEAQIIFLDDETKKQFETSNFQEVEIFIKIERVNT